MILSLLIVGISIFLFLRIIKLKSFFLTLFSCAPFLQVLIIFCAYYFLDGFFEYNFIHFSYLKEGDIEFILLNFCIYLLAIYGISLIFFLSGRTENALLRSISPDVLTFSIDKLVVIYSLMALLFLASTNLDNIFSKVARLGFYYFNFIPFLVAYFILRIKKWVLIIFTVAVIFFVAVNLITGSRGHVVTIFLEFTFGLIANRANRALLKRYFAVVLLVSMFVFPLMGSVEIFRGEYGRIKYGDVDQERIKLIGSEFKNKNKNKEKYEKSAEFAFARNIAWPNLSVMLLTGSVVEPVGFTNFENDVTFIFTNTFLSGKKVEEARQEYIDRLWGNGPANLYGYNVNVSTSVEFSVLADGIWRYGRFGFIYNLIILVMLGLLMERAFVRKIKRERISLFFILCIGNIYLIAMTSVNTGPLIGVIREMLNITVFSFFLSGVLKLLTQKQSISTVKKITASGQSYRGG